MFYINNLSAGESLTSLQCWKVVSRCLALPDVDHLLETDRLAAVLLHGDVQAALRGCRGWRQLGQDKLDYGSLES